MERKLFYKMVYVYNNSWELFNLTCKENEEFTDTVFREVTTTAMDWSGRLAWKELIGGGGEDGWIGHTKEGLILQSWELRMQKAIQQTLIPAGADNRECVLIIYLFH